MTQLNRSSNKLPPLLPLGPAFVVAVLLALAGAVAVLLDEALRAPGSTLSASGAWNQVYRLWPYIAVLALALCGFRRTAGLCATVGGVIATAYLGLYGVLGGTGGAFLFALLAHLGAAALGVAEVANQTTVPHTPPWRVAIGATAALLTWAAVAGIFSNQFAAQRKALGASELAARADSLKKARLWWSDPTGLQALTNVAYCLELARDKVGTGAYPHTLAQWRMLAKGPAQPCGWLFDSPDSSGAAFVGERPPHARIRYVPPPNGRGVPGRAGGFTLELEAVWSPADEPVPLDVPGRRSFLIDASGVLHVTWEHRRATVADSTPPLCADQFDNRLCSPYTPAERWGVTPDKRRPGQ